MLELLNMSRKSIGKDFAKGWPASKSALSAALTVTLRYEKILNTLIEKYLKTTDCTGEIRAS